MRIAKAFFGALSGPGSWALAAFFFSNRNCNIASFAAGSAETSLRFLGT